MQELTVEAVQAIFGSAADFVAREIKSGGNTVHVLFLDGITSGGDIAELLTGTDAHLLSTGLKNFEGGEEEIRGADHALPNTDRRREMTAQIHFCCSLPKVLCTESNRLGNALGRLQEAIYLAGNEFRFTRKKVHYGLKAVGDAP